MTFFKLSSFETIKLKQEKTCELVRTNSKALESYLLECRIPIYGRGRGCPLWEHRPMEDKIATVQYYHSSDKAQVLIRHVLYRYAYDEAKKKSVYTWTVKLSLIEQNQNQTPDNKE